MTSHDTGAHVAPTSFLQARDFLRQHRGSAAIPSPDTLRLAAPQGHLILTADAVP